MLCKFLFNKTQNHNLPDHKLIKRALSSGIDLFKREVSIGYYYACGYTVEEVAAAKGATVERVVKVINKIKLRSGL